MPWTVLTAPAHCRVLMAKHRLWLALFDIMLLSSLFTIWWSWSNHDTWQQETAVILLSLGKSTQVGSCSHLQLDSALRSCSTVAMMVPDNMTKPLHARKSRTCRQMCPPSSCTFLTRLQYAPRHNVDCPPCNHCYIGMCNVRCTLAARQFALYNKLWGGIAFFTT